MVLRGAVRVWASSLELASPLVGVGVFFSMLVTLSGVALLLAPPVAYDAVNYHLPLARAYAEIGSLQAALLQPYSYYPQSFELLLSWAYALGGAEAPRLLAAFYFGLAVAGAWCVGRRLEASRAATLLGVAAAVVMPAVHFPGVTVKNDPAIAADCLACLLCYFHWREQRRPAWFLLGTFFLAAAFGVKHTAAFAAVGLAPLWLYALWQSRGLRLRLAAGTALISLLTAGVWHLRAVMLTGNPTYPYHAGAMAEAVLEGPGKKDAPGDKSWAALMSVPQSFVDLHRDGSLVYESILPAPAGIFLILLLPAPLLCRSRHRFGLAASLFVFASLVVWAPAMTALRSLHADMTLRYVVPAFLVWPLLLAAPVTNLYQGFPRPARLIMAGVVAYAFLLPWTGLLIVENSGNQARYLAGSVSEGDYLAGAMLPYAAIQAASKAARPGDFTVSFHGCAALFYPEPWRFRCHRPYDWNNPAETISEGIDREDYSFLILPAEQAAFAPPQAEPIFRDGHYVTFRLTPASGGLTY
jgi:4-amino-4-deoxy-L-arabinose transferase-like glycosyltransferase